VNHFAKRVSTFTAQLLSSYTDNDRERPGGACVRGGETWPDGCWFNEEAKALNDMARAANAGPLPGIAAPLTTQPTLRDQYAMAALAGLCAFPGRAGENNRPEHFAEWSFAIADAMMAAREVRS
jgi:hypothetical protein